MVSCETFHTRKGQTGAVWLLCSLRFSAEQKALPKLPAKKLYIIIKVIILCFYRQYKNYMAS